MYFRHYYLFKLTNPVPRLGWTYSCDGDACPSRLPITMSNSSFSAGQGQDERTALVSLRVRGRLLMTCMQNPNPLPLGAGELPPGPTPTGTYQSWGGGGCASATLNLLNSHLPDGTRSCPHSVAWRKSPTHPSAEIVVCVSLERSIVA